jgi:sugar phosphate permease
MLVGWISDITSTSSRGFINIGIIITIQFHTQRHYVIAKLS